jgi:redox-sensitive bicupin YhaK (pirin superfamily)
MVYADVALEAGAVLPLDADYDERAIYTVSGPAPWSGTFPSPARWSGRRGGRPGAGPGRSRRRRIEIAGDGFGPGQLLVFRPGDRISVRATEKSRFMVLGGEPMDGPRHLWWNFVSSRPERIALARTLIRSPGRKTRSWPGPKPSPAISIAPDTV